MSMKHLCIVGGGAALAQPLIAEYLRRNWRVTAVCRNRVPLDSGEGLRVISGSIAWAAMGDLVEGIDALAVMTGSVANSTLVNMRDVDWYKVQDSCLTAPFTALKLLLPKMNRPGNVVVVGSIVGSMGGRGCCNYAAAKAGLVGLVRGAANEFAKTGVIMNLLELGYVDAGMGAELPPEVRSKVEQQIPLGRFAKPEEFVHAVTFLAETRYMHGDVLTLAGGLR